MVKVQEIELHAGHWSYQYSGANGVLNEVIENRRVGKRVRDILKSKGVPVTYFEDNASTNVNSNINTLVKHHNADKDGLVVSIHFNSSGGTTDRAIGTEVLYYDQKGIAEELAAAISKATGGGLKNRGAKKRTDLGVLARTYEPAVLIEVCFVNSTVDAAIYRRDFEKICQAIADVLAKYVITKTMPTTPQEEVNEVVEFLNVTGRNECKQLIARGVEEKLFTSKHEDVDNYTDTQLISFAMAYVNRKLKQTSK